MITYLTDERAISKKIGMEIPYPIRLFNLAGLGVNHTRFINDLAPTFETLPWDTYDVERERAKFIATHGDPTFLLQSTSSEKINLAIEKYYNVVPYRRRAIARFAVTYHSNLDCNVQRTSAETFSQNVSDNDYRSQKRTFKEMSEFVVQHPEFQKLLSGVILMVKNVRPETSKLVITAHQVGSVARDGKNGDNAPEGIHQDGADYIVSAIEIEQRGIRGGLSTVYLRPGDGRTIKCLERDLCAGEGIFQADKGSPLWHDVSPIVLIPDAGYEQGTRSTFGFDIVVEN